MRRPQARLTPMVLMRSQPKPRTPLLMKASTGRPAAACSAPVSRQRLARSRTPRSAPPPAPRRASRRLRSVRPTAPRAAPSTRPAPARRPPKATARAARPVRAASSPASPIRRSPSRSSSPGAIRSTRRSCAAPAHCTLTTRRTRRARETSFGSSRPGRCLARSAGVWSRSWRRLSDPPRPAWIKEGH